MHLRIAGQSVWLIVQRERESERQTGGLKDRLERDWGFANRAICFMIGGFTTAVRQFSFGIADGRQRRLECVLFLEWVLWLWPSLFLRILWVLNSVFFPTWAPTLRANVRLKSQLGNILFWVLFDAIMLLKCVFALYVWLSEAVLSLKVNWVLQL